MDNLKEVKNVPYIIRLSCNSLKIRAIKSLKGLLHWNFLDSSSPEYRVPTLESEVMYV